MITKLALSLLLAAGIYSALRHTPVARVSGQGVIVIDGDTIDVAGDRYRLLGFDTPETYNASCDDERTLGNMATRRLKALIGDGQDLMLEVALKRDRYNRKLARAFVSDQDIADIMISEGLARTYSGGKRQPWCSLEERGSYKAAELDYASTDLKGRAAH